ncbi:MAG: N-acetyl-gamma-glutamyl-phosphate reductase [Eggerthellaceae bacterium]|nr:N-acetyl-gamma-glutamyl-phosphate reductase [Eggerthellaceae bacterium]
MAYNTGVVGAAGFAGIELVRLLLKHPEFKLATIVSDSLEGKALAGEYPAFEGATDLVFMGRDDAPLEDCDIVFLAVPHTASLDITPSLLKDGITVIDLSADYRLKDAGEYAKWYETDHSSPELLEEAVLGLPELNELDILSAANRYSKGAPVLIACAGCYPTATSLAAAPAIRLGLIDPESVIVADAISGVTGAGRRPTARTHFCHSNENIEPYSIGSHRHTPEIEQILNIKDRLVFTPHLAPLSRGLLSTVTMSLSRDLPEMSTAEFIDLYEDFYDDEPLIKVLPEGTYPATSSVASTNFAHIGVVSEPKTRTIVAVCAIDNLGKGAAGQAVQCANILCGFEQDEGLKDVALPV